MTSRYKKINNIKECNKKLREILGIEVHLEFCLAKTLSCVKAWFLLPLGGATDNVE